MVLVFLALYIVVLSAATLAQQSSTELTNRGFVLVAQGRQAEALGAYEEALEINPQDALAWTGKGSLLVLRGSYKEAVSALEQATRIDPGQPVACLLYTSDAADDYSV